jgi:endonuclease/exonuclease/phosphatase family metal-dependent hydrolase
MQGRRRQLLRWVAITLAVAACRMPPNSLRPEPAPRPFFFIQMSDPQFGFFTANADFAKETVNFEQAIAIANRLKPAFVVVTGDLTHKVGDPAQIAEYKRIAAKLDKSIPLYNVSGNHDVGQVPTPQLLAEYRRNYGPDRYVFSHDAFTGVVLNSSLYKDAAGAPAEAAAQEAWLRTTLDSLQRAGRKQVVVFQHHSWFLENPDEADQYYNLPLVKRREALELFRQHGISKVFAGHFHGNSFGQTATGLDMITSGPVGRPMRTDPSGLRIVTVSGDRITHAYHALDAVPAAVTMPTPASLRDSSLRVMTFNIAAGNGDLARIAATIRRENPDLVALQEVDVHWGTRSSFADQARELGAQLGMEARFAPIYRVPGADSSAPRREYGVALLSRFPIATWRNDTITRLSTLTETPVPAPMPGFLAATVLVRGAAVRVFNTHTDYRPDPAVRVKQVAEMLRIVGEPRMPTLLFGDLNAPPDAPEMQPLLIRLRDAWPTANGDGFTYPATKPVKRIDYVLTSPHYRVLSARVPETNASDHRPVVVELVRDSSRP